MYCIAGTVVNYGMNNGKGEKNVSGNSNKSFFAFPAYQVDVEVVIVII